LALIFLGFLLSFASVFAAAEISTTLPGPYNIAETGPVDIIANAYYIALGVGGLLAFGSIVIAGIKWTTSQGNPGTISDAKDQIVQALWGLVLLGGAFVILNTINPELTVLRLPNLSEVVAPTSTVSAGGQPETCGTPPSSPGTCPTGKSCQQDTVSGNYHCIDLSYVYCGRALPDGTISKKCLFEGETCKGSGPAGDPSYECESSSAPKSYYYCKSGPGMIAGTCSVNPETLAGCESRCRNSGATCVESQAICNPK